jgi:hypothetical protein
VGEQSVGQWGWQSVEAAPRLTRSGAREAASLKRSGSRRPASSPFGFHVEAPALPGAGEFLPWLPGAEDFASPSGVAEPELPSFDAPQTVLSRIAPLLTAGLLCVIVALMFVLAVAAPR